MKTDVSMLDSPEDLSKILLNKAMNWKQTLGSISSLSNMMILSD